MFVQTVFWSHPLVSWIGKRMLEERERACDEAVLRTRCCRGHTQMRFCGCAGRVQSRRGPGAAATGANLTNQSRKSW